MDTTTSTASTVLDLIARTIGQLDGLDGPAPSALGLENYDGHAVSSPDDWRARGESVPASVVAVVHHEGPGPLARLFSLDACYRTGAASDYDAFGAMSAALEAAGLWAECQTGWLSFVFRTEASKPALVGPAARKQEREAAELRCANRRAVKVAERFGALLDGSRRRAGVRFDRAGFVAALALALAEDPGLTVGELDELVPRFSACTAAHVPGKRCGVCSEVA